ncbi:MAG TPA: hypothetical protein VMF11_06175 [Candidatus Baltobacteraceae bacterium]|nr:hypothetical protein [Candidatus Baltobacteraceae bacterium]
MKHVHLVTLALAMLLTAVPSVAPAQNLAKNAPTRQAIMELEYQLNQPGVPDARAAQLQSQIAQLETQANGSDYPTLPVPVYGSCDADNSAIAFLQDQLATVDLDYQQTVIDQRAIYDLGVNLKQRGC